MKETTAIQQMIQEMTTDYQCEQALKALALDDWFADLKAKNEAFLAKMNERTEAQAWQQKGIVRQTRLAAESAWRDLVKLINAASIIGVPESVDYDYYISQLNAEIEHYRQILARKGIKTGSSSDDPTPTPTPSGDDDTPSGGSDDTPSGGGDDEGGSPSSGDDVTGPSSGDTPSGGDNGGLDGD